MFGKHFLGKFLVTRRNCSYIYSRCFRLGNKITCFNVIISRGSGNDVKKLIASRLPASLLAEIVDIGRRQSNASFAAETTRSLFVILEVRDVDPIHQ